LRASLPIDDADEGDIRIEIDHEREENQLPSPQHHRIGANVPFADVVPPEGVPVIGLHSVRFSMALIRTKDRPKPKRQKLGKGAEFGDHAPRTVEEKSDTRTDETLFRPPSEDTEDMLSPEIHNSLNPLHVSYEGRGLLIIRNLKGLRSVTAKPSIRNKVKRKRPAATSNMDLRNPGTESDDETVEIAKLVDGAIRVSVCKGMLRLPQGVKLVTSTFSGGLSELCPAVWTIQYLPVFAVSANAHY